MHIPEIHRPFKKFCITFFLTKNYTKKTKFGVTCRDLDLHISFTNYFSAYYPSFTLTLRCFLKLFTEVFGETFGVTFIYTPVCSKENRELMKHVIFDVLTAVMRIVAL
jgi:hypothetical protein